MKGGIFFISPRTSYAVVRYRESFVTIACALSMLTITLCLFLSSVRCSQTVRFSYHKMSPLPSVSDSILGCTQVHVFSARSCLTFSIHVFVCLPLLHFPSTKQ